MIRRWQIKRAVVQVTVLAALAAPASAFAQDFTPAPTSPEPGGDRPGPFISADFNNDGNVDLAFNDGTNAVRVTLGNGAGDFNEPATSPEALPSNPNGDSAAGMAPGNFNGDANLDLVVSQNPSAFTILLGAGGGDFTKAPTSPKFTELFPRPAVGDFNSDGLHDVAIAGAGRVSIYLATGGGDFAQTPQTLSTSCDSQAIVVGDFNEDAKQDLAVTDDEDCSSLANSGVTRFLGNGTGAFTGGGRIIVQPDYDLPGELFLADVNRDGHQDFIVQTAGSTYVLLGNGANGFSPAPTSPEMGISASDVADFSGDGNPDLVIRDLLGNSIAIAPGLGNGDFAVPGSPEPVGQFPISVGHGDFDNDTDLDLAVGNAGSDDITILLNQVSGTAPPPGGGGGGADVDPPETTITKSPKKKLAKTTAKFKFVSDEPGSTFECQLKGKNAKKRLKKFQPCSSPSKYKKLKPGKFKFAVRGTDAAGNVDLTPAKKKFKRT